MNILVTGGMGFIGSNFIRFVLKNTSADFIINYDKLTYAANRNNLKNLESKQKSRYEFIRGDIKNYELLEYVVKKKKIDAIINFAAESHVDRSILNPNIFIETNVLGTQILLNVAKNLNIKRFIQISTDEVYGSLDFDEDPFTEESPLRPSSPYSASKTAADLLALAYYKTFNLNISITRCSNNYGPYQFPEKIIPLMINNIKHNKKLPIYGDGKNIRDWIYVEDHCRGILDVLNKGKPGEIYNFGGDTELSNIELVKILLKKMDKSEDLITFVKDRPGHDKRYAINFTKAKKELGWVPKYKFEDAIDKTIKWYLENERWLEQVISGEYLKYYKQQYGRSF
ncbi:MAG: dTDP-glucose 4,6-dehydratase [Promethearchaeota archaeon]